MQKIIKTYKKKLNIQRESLLAQKTILLQLLLLKTILRKLVMMTMMTTVKFLKLRRKIFLYVT